MLATTTHPVCRLATAEDDLSPCFGKLLPHEHVNRDQCLVAVLHERIIGLLIMWDGGHSTVMFDHFVVSPDAPTQTGPLLVLALNAWCQQHGKTALTFGTTSLELAYQAKRRGALVIGPQFRVTYAVTERTGASHG